METRKHKVFLAVPVGGDGGISVATHRAVGALAASKHDVECAHQGSSALTYNFNALWADALNRRMAGQAFDVFGMIHTDIAPQPTDWLDRLLTIFDETQADVLSVIMPIKDSKGLTSTAMDTSRWTPRRLTMQEVFLLPETFDGALIQAKFGAPLLINTGLMLVRFTEPWALEVCFNIDNCIALMGGRYQPFFEPEDWKFSRWCNAHSLKLVATRAVAAGHLGQAMYANTSPWGEMGVDSINLTNSAMGANGMIPK